MKRHIHSNKQKAHYEWSIVWNCLSSAAARLERDWKQMSSFSLSRGRGCSTIGVNATEVLTAVVDVMLVSDDRSRGEFPRISSTSMVLKVNRFRDVITGVGSFSSLSSSSPAKHTSSITPPRGLEADSGRHSPIVNALPAASWMNFSSLPMSISVGSSEASNDPLPSSPQ